MHGWQNFQKLSANFDSPHNMDLCDLWSSSNATVLAPKELFIVLITNDMTTKRTASFNRHTLHDKQWVKKSVWIFIYRFNASSLDSRLP